MKNLTNLYPYAIAAIIIILTIVLGACVGSSQNGNSSDKTPTRQISVVGQGKVYLIPDVAYVTIGVRSESEDVSEALSKNNTQANAVAKAVREMGVNDKDIQTSAFNIYPQQEFGPKGEVVRTFYVVDNVIYVTVHDLNSLGVLLNSVVKSGATNISGIQFDVLDKSKAITEARRLAIEDARKQAEELVKAAGVQLGSLITMNVYNAGGPYPVFEAKGGRDTSAAQVPVSAGQLVLQMEAQMTYELK